MRVILVLLRRYDWLGDLELSTNLIEFKMWTLTVPRHRHNFKYAIDITHIHICQSIILQLVDFWWKGILRLALITFKALFFTVAILNLNLMHSFTSLFLLSNRFVLGFSVTLGSNTKAWKWACSWWYLIMSKLYRHICLSCSSLNDSGLFLALLCSWRWLTPIIIVRE